MFTMELLLFTLLLLLVDGASRNCPYSDLGSSKSASTTNKTRFDRTVAMSVDVSVNEPAYLHCRVLRQDGHQVAWTRGNDNNLLTVGELSFTSDPRFQVSVKKSDSDWILIIRQFLLPNLFSRTEQSDTGCYLCEVNTEPESQIFPVFLNVIDFPMSSVDSSTTTTSSRAYQNDVELTITSLANDVILICTVKYNESDDSPTIPVIWTKDDSAFRIYDDKRFVLSLKTRRKMVVHVLEIRNATEGDEGIYACKAGNSPIQRQRLVGINAPAFRIMSPLSISPIMLSISAADSPMNGANWTICFLLTLWSFAQMSKNDLFSPSTVILII